MRSKKGLTFAEFLIALTVIGVVAVLAIPVFMKIQQDKDIVSRLEASRSTIAQATKMAETQIAALEDWDLTDMETPEIFDFYYKPYINFGENCTGKSQKCWTTTYNFRGEDKAEGGAKYGITGNAPVSFILSDGINVTMTKTKNLEEKFGVESDLPTTIVFMVDVNGNKKPNRIGQDVFAFVLTSNGLMPAGTDSNSGSCERDSNLNDDYWDCSAKVLNDGKRDYI